MTDKKGGVKFQDQAKEQAPEKPQASQQQISYRDGKDQREISIKSFNKITTQFKTFTAQDPDCRRKDTAHALKHLLEDLRQTMTILNMGTFQDKVQNYYLLYNATIYLFDICTLLRKSVYQSTTIEYIAFAITSMEGNIQLLQVKYLDWRVRLYMELAQIYFSLGSTISALRTIELGLAKVQELREYEEVDPPLPDYIDRALLQNQRSLRILELKFRIQSGLPLDQWKKKIEEYFSKDPEAKCIAIIESLRLSPPQSSNTLKQTAMSAPAQFPWKDQLVTASYDILKADIDKVTLGLEQTQEKILKTVDFHQTLSQTKPDKEEDEAKRQELIKKRREYESTLIKEKDWRKSALNIPLEYQVELANHAFDCGNTKIFEEVSESALKRCKNRRLECPYIVEVDILISTTPYPNIPNGFEKIPIDLNEASLRLELKKLRNRAKNDQKEEKKEEKKDDKKPGKGQQIQQQQQQVVDIVGMGVQATEQELQKINHNYVFLAYRTSNNPEKAIHQIDVVMADENDGPQLQEGQIAIAIPIKQYTGVRETNKTVPYLVVSHSQNKLQSEEQKLSLITHLKPLFGKHPQIRPDFGYVKIMCDLRQTPKEFIRSPNMDYLFLTYKVERFFHINEREIQVLVAFNALEKTYIREKSLSIDDDARLELDLCYDLDALNKLITVLGQCLMGTLGESFLMDRRDFLIQLVFQMWKKYFVSQLHQIDFIQHLKISRELSTADSEIYDQWIQRSKSIFKEGLLVFNQILFKFDVDLILLSKVNLALSKLCEEDSDYQSAISNLRECLQKIENYRTRRLCRGVESQKDLFLPFSVTCSNQKIQQMVEKMKDQYVATKNKINREIRKKQRYKANQPALDADEEDEEEFEILDIQSTFMNNNNRDQEYFNYLDKQVEGMAIDNTNLLICSIHVDILVNLYRCELKAGNTQKIQQQSNQLEGLEGISTGIIKKMTIGKGPTAQSIKKNLTQLQTTLQKEGKIEPPKPLIHDYEKNLMGESNKNSYANCLLYMMMASNKGKQSEQKSLLIKSLEFLKEADKEESIHIQNGIKDSIFVLSTLLDNADTLKSAEQYFPFQMLYNPEYISESQVPRKPILISRTSTSVTFKLPPFKPHLIDVGHIDPAKKNILSMAIFGKISANGVNVSLTCDDLPNTGTRQKVGGVVHISNLKPNSMYCFAVAGYDGNEAVSNGIGETGDDICLLHPLPLPLLASYLSKTAYQLSHFDIAEEAADMCVATFIEDSGFLDRMLDNQTNPVHLKRFIQKRIREVGLLEISNLTETLLIKAKAMKRRLLMEQDDPKFTPAHWQKQTLKICNYLLLSLESSVCAHTYPLAKRLIGELFNTIEQFLNLSTKPLQIFHLLLKAQMVVVEIPKQYWDANLRILSGKITYEIMKLCLQLNEITLGRRVLYSELQTFNRKWYQIPRMIMVEEQQQVQAATKKDTKKDPKKPAVAETTNQEVAQVKMIPKLVRDLYESASSVQDYLEETLLSMHEEFGEYVSQFVDKWRESIDQLTPYVENPADQIERALSDLSIKLECWDYYKDLGSAFQKIQTNLKSSPFYLEMVCKLFRRMLESGVDVKLLLDNIALVTEPTAEHLKISAEIRDLQLAAINGDIEFYPNSLQYLIDERETNKQGNDEAINIFEQYFTKKQTLDSILQEEYIPEYGLGSLTLQAQRFDRMNVWQSEFNGLKAILFYQIYKRDFKLIKEVQPDQFCSVFDMDLKKMKDLVAEYDGQESIRQQFKQQKLQAQQAAAQVQAQPVKGAPSKVVQQAKVEISEEDAFKQMIEGVYKHVAYACSNALYAREYTILINQIKFLRNLVIYEQITPFQQLETEGWKYLTLIGMCVNQMLKDIQKKGYDCRRREREADFFEYAHKSTKVQLINQLEQEPPLPVLTTHLSKEFWFTEIKQLDMDILANVQAYIIQTLMVNQKWNSLIAISREFCNATTHYYSLQILPFTVHAQSILLNEAQPKRKAKEQELREREIAFQFWVNNKKKKTRSAILTQEVAPEEIEYERDKNELQRQIALLLQKEKFIQQQLEHSEKLIGEIQRDANQALEGLKQARKMYEKGAVDERRFWIEASLYEFHNEMYQLSKIQSTPNDQYLRSTRKAHKQYQTQIATRYKLAIEVLRKRQEKFALVLALKELGNLNHAMNNPAQAEEMWNDSLDTIFQRIYTIKQSAFRKMIQDAQQPLAQTYGIQQCLIGLNLCSTLAHYNYTNNIHQQRECQILASELTYSVFKMHLPNSMSWAAMVYNQTCELGEIDRKLFKDRFVLDPAETALSCERLSWQLLDREDPVRTLPMLILLKQLSIRLSSPFITIRSMLMLSLALSNMGCINESYQLLLKVAGEKDLPLLPIGSRGSFWQSKTFGEYWFGAQQWNNSIPPYDEKHIALTEQILKELQLSKAFGIKYGLLNENLFNFALATLVYNIHCFDIVEKWEINEMRNKILYKVDALIRSTLKKISFDEDLDFQIYLAKKEEELIRQSNETLANETAIKRKDEIYSQVKGSIQDQNEFDQLYNLLIGKQAIGVSNNEENLPYFEKRTERLHMIARLRSLLAKVNISVGQTTRALYIYKQAVENIQQYCFEVRKVEQGEEPEVQIPLDQLKPMAMEVDNKKGAKAPAPAASTKDDKKGKAAKQDLEEEKKKEEERIKKEQMEIGQIITQIVETRKSRRCIGVFWWNRLRVELLQTLFKQNRLKECSDFIESIKNDVKTFNDPYYQRIITEYRAKILVRNGKFDEAIKSFEEALAIAHQYNQTDMNLVNMIGDYAELLRERSHHEEALQLLNQAQKIAETNLNQLGYGYGQFQNLNKKAIFDEKIQVSNDLQISRDAEEEITKKSDKLNKPGKKDEKKGQEGKSNKKGPDKGQQKQQVQQEKPQLKINHLNPLSNTNFSQPTNVNYYPLENDQNNNTAPVHNCYIRGIETWVRSTLRYLEQQMTVDQVLEDSPPPKDQDSFDQSSISSKSEHSKSKNPAKNEPLQDDQLIEILSKIELVLDTSFGLPLSFRLELYLLQAKVYKRKFIRMLLNFQDEYFKKYLHEKNKKYRKFWDRRPYRDLVRNIYFQDIPGFTQALKDIGHNYLFQSKESLRKAINIVRGESLLYEFYRKPEEVMMEMAEICLLQREYRQRIGYRHVKDWDLQKYAKDENSLKELQQNNEKQEKVDQMNLELEAHSYLKFAIDLVQARMLLCEQYHELGKVNLSDVTKLPLDVFTEIIEQDYLCKKNYPSMLFEESKKKVGVNSIDVMVFMQKTWREARIMTFGSNHLQRYISKIHRYLKASLTSYQKCVINTFEVAPKNDIQKVFVDEGSIVARCSYDRLRHEFKLVYVLGALNPDSIKSTLSAQERDKILLLDSQKDIYYGNIYISESNLSILLQESLDLRSQLEESREKSEKAKERDKKHQQKQYYQLFESLGTYFFQKSIFNSSDKYRQRSSNNEEQMETDLLDKYGVFVPELTKESIDFLINLFGEIGVSEKNHNILVLMRYFHKSKYK